jgi:hypothetical protein
MSVAVGSTNPWLRGGEIGWIEPLLALFGASISSSTRKYVVEVVFAIVLFFCATRVCELASYFGRNCSVVQNSLYVYVNLVLAVLLVTWRPIQLIERRIFLATLTLYLGMKHTLIGLVFAFNFWVAFFVAPRILYGISDSILVSEIIVPEFTRERLFRWSVCLLWYVVWRWAVRDLESATKANVQ